MRLLTHVFRAENPTVFWESRSIGRRPAKWLERRRIIPTFYDAHYAVESGIDTDQSAFRVSASRALESSVRSLRPRTRWANGRDPRIRRGSAVLRDARLRDRRHLARR